jgi:hypothetical protein
VSNGSKGSKNSVGFFHGFRMDTTRPCMLVESSACEGQGYGPIWNVPQGHVRNTEGLVKLGSLAEAYAYACIVSTTGITSGDDGSFTI